MFELLMQTGGEAAQTQNPAPAGGGIIGFLPFILMIAILYFLMIRPQQKKQKEHREMLNQLKTHDIVITNGGIIGKIVNFKKDKTVVVLRVDDTTNTKIEFQRSSIVGVINDKKEETTDSSN